MSNEFWGYHLILDCKAGDLCCITDPGYITMFSSVLVDAIKMKAFGEPIVQNFAHENAKTGGITLVQLIETSNITCHFVESTGDFYLDVFSCACYDIQVVINLVQNWFNPESIKVTYLTRQA